MVTIDVDEDVRQLILREKHDYRVCTACRGPALVPTTVKLPKASDIRIPVGDHVLYVSAVQAGYINRVSIDMLYDENDIFSCPALLSLRDSGYLDKERFGRGLTEPDAYGACHHRCLSPYLGASSSLPLLPQYGHFLCEFETMQYTK